MNPLLKPVMIRRHNQKQEDEAGHRQIAAVISAGSEQRDGGDDAGNEDSQTVGGEAGTDRRSARDEPFDPAHESMQLSGPRECRHRLLTILEGPLGVND